MAVAKWFSEGFRNPEHPYLMVTPWWQSKFTASPKSVVISWIKTQNTSEMTIFLRWIVPKKVKDKSRFVLNSYVNCLFYLRLPGFPLYKKIIGWGDRKHMFPLSFPVHQCWSVICHIFSPWKHLVSVSDNRCRMSIRAWQDLSDTQDGWMMFTLTDGRGGWDLLTLSFSTSIDLLTKSEELSLG